MRRFLSVFGALVLLVAATVGAKAGFTYYVWPAWIIDPTTLNMAYYNSLLSLGHSTSSPVHLASAQTTAPALTSCGTSPVISGSDAAGTVTMGTGTPTGCVITFNAAYTTAPHCLVVWEGTPLAAQNYTTSTTAITTVQTATSSNKIDYFCVAPSGG